MYRESSARLRFNRVKIVRLLLNHRHDPEAILMVHWHQLDDQVVLVKVVLAEVLFVEHSLLVAACLHDEVDQGLCEVDQGL